MAMPSTSINRRSDPGRPSPLGPPALAGISVLDWGRTEYARRARAPARARRRPDRRPDPGHARPHRARPGRHARPRRARRERPRRTPVPIVAVERGGDVDVARPRTDRRLPGPAAPARRPRPRRAPPRARGRRDRSARRRSASRASGRPRSTGVWVEHGGKAAEDREHRRRGEELVHLPRLRAERGLRPRRVPGDQPLRVRRFGDDVDARGPRRFARDGRREGGDPRGGFGAFGDSGSTPQRGGHSR